MIDKELQEELRERFNPDGSELRRYQLYLLDMLKDFDALCRRHDIKYWLSSGTCIGAVRHGGFIPWDDDVDVEMLPEDYKKLLSVFSEDERYVLQTIDSDPYYAISFSKFRDKHSRLSELSGLSRFSSYSGAFIDIFPMERASKVMTHVSSYLTLPMLYLWSNIIIPKFDKYPGWLRGAFRIQKGIVRGIVGVCRMVNSIYPTDALYHALGSPFYVKRRWREDVFPTVNMKFEDGYFPVPNNYHHYLTELYGNYEALPPIERIQAPHVNGIEYVN